MSWEPKELDSVSVYVWQTIIIAVGVSLFFVHIRHLFDKPSTLALLVGVVIPLAISVAVIGVGVLVRSRESIRNLAPWMTTWMVLAMIWMAIAGTGAVIYEQSEGASLTHTIHLILTFATYGCLPGLVTGWYDGRRRIHLADVSEREDQLAVLSRVLRHNLRNEMNVILGHSEILLRDEDASVQDHAAKIQGAGQTLLELTEKERLLIDAVMDTPERTRLHLGELLSTVLPKLRAEHPEADLKVEGNIDRPVKAVPKFERALHELIENAIVHNNSPVPEVTIRVESTGDTVTLRILDNGPGISAAEARVLVGEQPITPLNHGSGLGVRLANLIVEQSGGNLELIPSNGKGTEVPVTICAA